MGKTTKWKRALPGGLTPALGPFTHLSVTISAHCPLSSPQDFLTDHCDMPITENRKKYPYLLSKVSDVLLYTHIGFRAPFIIFSTVSSLAFSMRGIHQFYQSTQNSFLHLANVLDLFSLVLTLYLLLLHV